MAGSPYKAALRVLESFRNRGLYLGANSGHMLETAFYSNTKLKYRVYGDRGGDEDQEVRNCFWGNVFHHFRHFQVSSGHIEQTGDIETKTKGSTTSRRTTQRVQHLHLLYAKKPTS